jgi:hypothetical protein
VNLTASHWLVLQIVVTAAFVIVLSVGLAGFSFRLLGLPWAVWNFTLPGAVFLIDGQRRSARVREQERG